MHRCIEVKLPAFKGNITNRPTDGQTGPYVSFTSNKHPLLLWGKTFFSCSVKIFNFDAN